MAREYLRPSSEEANTGGLWTATGAATTWECLDDLIGAPDDVTTYVTWAEASEGQLRLGLPSLAGAALMVGSVLVRARCWGAAPGDGGGRSFKVLVYTSGAAYYGSTETAPDDVTPAWYEYEWVLNPATGVPWTTADIAALQIGLETFTTGGGKLRSTQVYAQVDYASILAETDRMRDVGSRYLRRWRRPRRVVSIPVPLDVGLNCELLGKVPLSHAAYPSPDGLGAGLANWQRAQLIVTSIEPDPQANLVRLTLEDSRFLRYLFWWVARSTINSSELEEGIARATAGQTLTYARSNAAWVIDPGSRLIVAKAANVKKIDVAGTLVERAATNYVPYSAFGSGLTGWTSGGAGTVAADTADLMTASDVSGYSLKLTADSPLVSGANITSTATADVGGLASDKVVVSVWHKDDSSQKLVWGLQRTSDSKWYRASDQTWQVAEQKNDVTMSATAARYTSGVIDFGAAGVETLKLKLSAEQAAGQINHVYHAQIEEGLWASSEIVTAASAVTRAADTLTVSNNSGCRYWNAARGTACWEVTPHWSSANVSGKTFYLLRLTYDANNSVEVRYNGTMARWEFSRVVGGAAAVTAYLAAAVVADTTYRVGVYWTGTDGELSLAAYTQGIVVDGVEGTQATAAGAPTETTPINAYLGSDATPANHFDGAICSHISEQWVRRLQEIARFP